MSRIIARINIYGNKCTLEPLVIGSAIPNGELKQIGLLRKIPDVDRWVYQSPYYQFHWETLDDELHNFLKGHHLLEAYKVNEKKDIKYSMLVICPVEQSFEETFSCYLTHKTIMLLDRLSLGLEIAPEERMPEAPFWADQEQHDILES